MDGICVCVFMIVLVSVVINSEAVVWRYSAEKWFLKVL